MKKTRLIPIFLLMLPLWAVGQPQVTVTDFSGRGGVDKNKVTGMVTDRRGLLWVSTWGGLYRYDGYQFVTYRIRPGDGNELDNSRMDDVQQDGAGNLVCRSYDDYYLFDFSTNKFRLHRKVEGMEESRRRLHSSGEFTRCGYRMKVKDGQLQWLDEKARSWQPLVENLRLAHVNPQGVVWAVMDDGSFKRIVVSSRQYVLTDEQENVLTLYRDEHGIIWQANDDGSLLLRDGYGERIGYVSVGGNVSTSKVRFARVYSMAGDGKGHIYIGTRGDGLYVMSPNGKGYSVARHVNVPSDTYSLSDNNVYSLCCDGDAVWVGTHTGGLNLMKKEGGRVVFLNKNNRCKNFPACDRNHSIRSIVKIGDVVVLGTIGGIYTFKSSDRPEQAYLYHSQRLEDNPKSLAGNEVMAVDHIAGKGIFVSTSYGGLCRMVSKNLLQDNLEFDTWNMDSNAPSDQALCTFADKDGQVWAVFKDALSKLDVNTMTSVDFLTEASDFESLTGTRPVMTDDGNTCLGTVHGVARLNLATLRHSPYKAPILITSLNANGRNMPYSLNADTIMLKKDQRNFSIEFAALEMAGSENVEYAYRLEGRDSTWIKTGRNRVISFFGMGAGTYTLLIKATDNNRVWGNGTRRVTIIVEPTFGETPWAWLLCGLLALALVALVILIIMYIYRLRLNVDFEKRMTSMKLKYFTDISHDLRTPLTLIEGPVTEMLQDTSLTEQNRGYLSLIHHNAQRMLTLVNQILDFRKIQNHKMRLLVERMDLKEELTEVMENFRYLAEDGEMEFKLVDKTSEAAYVWGDKDKVQKIFFNLLSNAFKYTVRGNKIWIELEGDNDTVSASVCDTGKGISPNVMARLFARFETIISDNYMKSSTGIGLSLVKELVELHHAQLKVESQEGEGSRFKVVFRKGNQQFLHDDYTEMMTTTDRQAAAEWEDVKVAQASEASVGTPTVSVMVVEDDAEMLQFVSEVLGTEYQVLQAVDGQDGLAKALASQPDLIISDIKMPRMDGWTMLDALKKNSGTSHIPVVLLTANGTLDDQIRGAQQGVEDYIVKPFSTEYLRVRVRGILKKRHSMQQRYMEHFMKAGDVMKLELPQDNSGVERRMAKIDADMMERLKDFMEENLSVNTPIQELAGHVGMSRTLFYNKIRSITGLTPIDFYRKYHVERAAQMMREDGFMVSEACYATGFSDPKYFSKVFKKFFGMSPSDYRNGKE